MQLYNDDCFNIFPKIKDKSINLFVLDLPYANFKFGKCTSCKWDLPIDLDKMWVEIKRMMKPNATIVFFCNTKFGYALIDSNPKWFKYDLIWKKSRKVGFLRANKQPLRQHENIYVFDNREDDIEIKRNLDLRDYAQKVKNYISKPQKEIDKAIGNQGFHHFLGACKSSQFELPIKKNYEKLTKIYKINEMEGFIEYDILKDMEEVTTYNPQKIEGKPYQTKGKGKCDVYNTKRIDGKNKGDRHPASILPDMELEEHENIYLFNGMNEDNEELINYSKKILKFINKTKAEIKRNIKDADHFFRYSKDNFSICNKKTYNELIEKYKINEMEGFMEYEDLDIKYNPQKTEGKSYQTKGNDLTNSYYRGGNKEYKSLGNKNKGDRHPTSILPDMESTILEYKNPHKTIHRTQKPEKLLEWLIKSYSNEDDLVMDFCMGSGTAGVACKNTNRKFIGIEMNEDIFKLAEERINTSDNHN